VTQRFEATVDRRGSGHVVRLPFDPKEAFGRVRAPVVVTVNEHSFRTTTMRYGGDAFIGLNRDVREAAGLADGDRAEFELTLDTEPREVEVPKELAAAFEGDPAARSVFEALSYTHRREYARWIGDAKREETRAKRVDQALEMLHAGVRTPDEARRHRD
jgi:Bacteriocin-protection, YdeI or OmpD-Associated/Domain of unknown function (DUF1905)